MNENKTCGDCLLFAPEPVYLIPLATEPCYGIYGACLGGFEMRQDISGRIVATYDATKSNRKACPSFEPKEDER